MVTVEDLALKLAAYCRENPENGLREVWLAYDGNIALPFSRGTDNMVAGKNGVDTMLVLRPDFKDGRKLVLEKGDAL